MLLRPALPLAVLILTLPATASGQQHASHPGTLGTVVFPNSGKPAAQAPFLRGVALLHSFEYERAAEAFREAQAADSSFALAYWGEALTYSHVLWREENLPSSRAALARLAPTSAERLARAGSDRERSFGAAVEAFYTQGTLAERVGAYADAMRRHAQAEPGEQEAAAFAAHAIMLAAYAGDPAGAQANVKEAIELAQRVAKANPDHPGAVHYLIHLYDTPGMAVQGLEFARAYDKIAPDAEHALHMPSHIYLQLGLWEDVVQANERAWPASRSEVGGPSWHAFSWLQYGYLQQGRWAEARGLIDSARTIIEGSPAYADARFVLPRLEFQYAAETGRWERPIARPQITAAEPASERERGFRLFAEYWRAVDAAQRDDPELAAIAAPYLAIADSVTGGSGARRSPVQASNALVIRALVARSRGDKPGYLASLRAAAEFERKLNAFVGPPERVFALELLGAELLAAGSNGEAASAYQDVLKICPNRSQSLLGVARAKAAAGAQAEATRAMAALQVNWKRADPEVKRSASP